MNPQLRPAYPKFSKKACVLLISQTQQYLQHNPKPQPQWIERYTMARQLCKLSQRNPLIAQLAKDARNPAEFFLLVQSSARYMLRTIPILRATEELLPPNHPSIIYNSNHPRNPNNPLNLQLNAENLDNIQFIATQSAIVREENLEQIEMLEALEKENESLEKVHALLNEVVVEPEKESQNDETASAHTLAASEKALYAAATLDFAATTTDEAITETVKDFLTATKHEEQVSASFSFSPAA